MPANTDPYVIEIVLKGAVITEETLNVFHFASPTLTDTIADIIQAFYVALGPTLINLIGTSSVFSEVTGQFVRGSILFGSQPLVGQSGTVSGDQLPPYATWDFTYVRGGALERNGYKRFSGVPESFQANGVASGSGPANLAVLAGVLGAGFNSGTDDWTPVIKRTKIAHVTQTPPKYYSVSSVVYSKIGTQNSRKFGHGR
jgi:hypothetical protein